MSVLNTVLAFSALTRKDHSDLEAALDAGVDWIALSFVQRPEDIAEAKKIARGRAAVMAKMEKPQAVEHLAEIIDVADALMVARGDLGLELPLEKVPALQKRMKHAAWRAGKPVVVATQMLESMISSPVPTGPRCPTSPPRSMRVPMPSCCRRNRRPASSRSRPSPRWTASPWRLRPIRPTAPSSMPSA
jgi:pyruvate kinase